jgi:hypothetical protein
MRNHNENLASEQANRQEKLKEARIDARTTVIAQELSSLEEKLAAMSADTTQDDEERRKKIQSRIRKNKEYIDSLHRGGFRELHPEDSLEELRSELERLSVEIALKEDELSRLQKIPLSPQDMFVRRENEPPNDILVRKMESLALIRATLLQRSQESRLLDDQNMAVSQGVDQTLFSNAKDLEKRLRDLANKTSANEEYFSSDPKLAELVTLRREIDKIVLELESASRSLERLQKERDDLNFIINVSPEGKEQLKQENSKNITTLYSKVTMLSKKLSTLIEEQSRLINLYLTSGKQEHSKIAH